MQFSEDIANAMAPGTELEDRLMEMVGRHEVDLLDEN